LSIWPENICFFGSNVPTKIKQGIYTLCRFPIRQQKSKNKYASKLQHDDKLKIAQSSASYCFMKIMGEQSFPHMQTQALLRVNAVHNKTLTRRVQHKNKF
jgi:hypothetical protein